MREDLKTGDKHRGYQLTEFNNDKKVLLVMGGTMSVNDEANYPWLKIEKRWLRRYLASGKPAIGLCLGGR